MLKNRKILSRLINQKWLTAMVICSFLACQQKNNTTTENPVEHSANIEIKDYPQFMDDLFQAHGGLENWNSMKSLYFEMPNDEGGEKHFVNLKDRRDKVIGPNFSLGFDGSNVWLDADSTYQGNPTFYHNLMFYFYAMPFVLADDGIIYRETDPLNYQGVDYPGMRISYQEGVGASSDDEYFIYIDPETNKMAWLGYTVTYFSQEPSSDIHWIRYDSWQNLEGLWLPEELSWYHYLDGKPTELRNTVSFQNVELGEQPHPEQVFAKTADAIDQ